MRYGTVVQFFPAKGFGFIRPDVGSDIFFHVSAIGACEPIRDIPLGQAVKFELIPGTEPKRRRRGSDDDEATETELEKPVRPQAKLVELIDRIPGGTLEGADSPLPDRHPRSRRKKPTWRR